MWRSEWRGAGRNVAELQRFARAQKVWVGTVGVAGSQIAAPHLHVRGWNGADAHVIGLQFPKGFVARKPGETCDELRIRCRLDAAICDPSAPFHTCDYVYSEREFGS